MLTYDISPSTVAGCRDLRNARRAVPQGALEDKAYPTVSVLAALDSRGWRPSHQAGESSRKLLPRTNVSETSKGCARVEADEKSNLAAGIRGMAGEKSRPCARRGELARDL